MLSIHFIITECPAGWKNVYGRCVYFSDEKIGSWNDAKIKCEDLGETFNNGAKLASIRNQYDQDAFVGKIMNYLVHSSLKLEK